MRLWALILALHAVATAAFAEVHVWFEPRVIDELDSLQLNVRATDTQLPDAPDLSVLESDFEILGSQTTSQRRSVNGNVESWVDYQYTLRPRRSGEITIPPIRVGDQYSAPTLVIVRALDPSIKQSIERMVFFETELTQNPVYVQAQTIFIRRLYYANGVQLYSDLPGAPDVANAVIVPLGDTKSSTTLVQGTRYGVIEQRFAIFPEQSGELHIPESAITSSVRVRRDGRTRRSGIRISAPAQSITVLPIPAEYPADVPWLAATDIQLRETWSPERTTYNLGDPLSRAIAVTAIGNTGSSIPPLQVNVPGEYFKLYPEPPTLDDDATGTQVIGSRIESYSLIPTAPGSVTLPPLTLTWWDTQARTVRTAHAPPRLLNLRGNPGPTFSPPASDTPQAEPAEAVTSSPASTPTPNWGAIAALALALAALIGWLTRKLWPKLVRLGRFARPSGSRRQAHQQLKRACADGELSRVREALLGVIHSDYGGDPSSALARFLEVPAQATLWRQLNDSIYGPDQTAVNRTLGADVWRCARGINPSPAKPPASPLPPLYSAD